MIKEYWYVLHLSYHQVELHLYVPGTLEGSLEQNAIHDRRAGAVQLHRSSGGQIAGFFP